MKLTFILVGFAALTLAAVTNNELGGNVHRFSQVSEDPSTPTAGTTGATAGTTDTKPLNDSTASSTTPKEEPTLHKGFKGGKGIKRLSKEENQKLREERIKASQEKRKARILEREAQRAKRMADRQARMEEMKKMKLERKGVKHLKKGPCAAGTSSCTSSETVA